MKQTCSVPDSELSLPPVYRVSIRHWAALEGGGEAWGTLASLAERQTAVVSGGVPYSPWSYGSLAYAVPLYC